MADQYDERCVTDRGGWKTSQFKRDYMGRSEAGERRKEQDLGGWGAGEWWVV